MIHLSPHVVNVVSVAVPWLGGVGTFLGLMAADPTAVDLISLIERGSTSAVVAAGLYWLLRRAMATNKELQDKIDEQHRMTEQKLEKAEAQRQEIDARRDEQISHILEELKKRK